MNLSKTAALAAVAIAATLSANPLQAQERNIRVAMTGSADHPAGQALAKTIECAAAKSGGKLKLRGFFDASLGSEQATISQVRTGSLEAILTTTASMATSLPGLGVLDLPFLFANDGEVDKVLDGRAGDYLAAMLPGAGMVGLGWWENGFRNATNNKRPITKWEDFQGLKIRVIPNKVFVETFTKLGANAVPMPWPEVYSALDTKALDGQENPVGIIHALKVFEVQKYLSMTRHVYSPVIMVMSKKVHDQLSPDEQKVMRECGVMGGQLSRSIGREREAKSLTELKAKGMVINDLAPAELARMREQVKPVYASQAAGIGQDTVNTVLAEIEKVRAGK